MTSILGKSDQDSLYGVDYTIKLKVDMLKFLVIFVIKTCLLDIYANCAAIRADN